MTTFTEAHSRAITETATTVKHLAANFEEFKLEMRRETGRIVAQFEKKAEDIEERTEEQIKRVEKTTEENAAQIQVLNQYMYTGIGKNIIISAVIAALIAAGVCILGFVLPLVFGGA